MKSQPAFRAPIGGYAQRAGDVPPWQDAWRWLRSRFARRAVTRLPPRVARSLAAARTRLAGADKATLAGEAAALRLELLHRGLDAERCGRALALAAATLAQTLGKTPYDTQLLAAWLMLEGRLVEMATGEGKTLAAALAAAVAALAGAPVHLLTANDYLAQRDRDLLAPFYAALSLRSGCVGATLASDERAGAWACDIVHTTAREVAFDYLRDHLALGGERDTRVLRAAAIAAADTGCATAQSVPALPGLRWCLIDEADSILLDEAVMPLILARPAGTLDADGYRRAYEISCTLQRQRDYLLAPARRSASLTADGQARVNAAVRGASGVLAPARRACELVEAALAARLLYRRDREYARAGERLLLIDELTGRIAEGRQWQGALQTMVEIKEGLAPGAPTAIAAQITYQRLFPRYLHLGGMSGTLLEARHELRLLYGAPVARVPLAKTSRLRCSSTRVWRDAQHKHAAVLRAVRVMHAAARPVLVGTDSVAESAQLSALLHASGIAHQLLNATQDADEAAAIARAGRAGMVTVATNIAGRGTDIRLDAAARSAGGLHVIATMRNRARRIDRQLAGRAARHGDPGSAQAVLALDDPLLLRLWPRALLRAVAACADSRNGVPRWLAAPLFAIAQRSAEWHERGQRRELLRADRVAGDWLAFAGGAE